MPTTTLPKCRPQTPRRRRHRAPLQTLFGQEKTFCYTIPPVVLLNSKDHRRESHTRSDILLVESKSLRIERDISAKRLDRERHRTLKSAIHALLSAKKKIDEGGDVNEVLEGEIEGLMKKMAELKMQELLNFELKQVGGVSNEKCVMNVQENAKSHLLKIGVGEGSSVANEACCRIGDVEILSCKMEGKLLKKMEEEYGIMSSATKISSSLLEDQLQAF